MLCQSPRTTSYRLCPQKGRQCLQFQVSNSCCLIIDSFPKSSSWAFSYHFCFKEARRRSLVRKAWRKDRRNKISKVRYLVKNMKEERMWEKNDSHVWGYYIVYLKMVLFKRQDKIHCRGWCWRSVPLWQKLLFLKRARGVEWVGAMAVREIFFLFRRKPFCSVPWSLLWMKGFIW